MGGLQNMSACMKGAWGALDLAGILYVISYAAPYWIELQVSGFRVMHGGIWVTCQIVLVGGTASEECNNSQDVIKDMWSSGWVGAVQGMSTVAFLLTMLAAALVNCGIFIHQLRRNMGAAYVSMLITFTSSVFAFMTAVIYGARAGSEMPGSTLSWAYYLWVLSILITLSATVLLLGEFVDLQDLRKAAPQIRRARINPVFLPDSPGRPQSTTFPVPPIAGTRAVN